MENFPAISTVYPFQRLIVQFGNHNHGGNIIKSDGNDSQSESSATVSIPESCPAVSDSESSVSDTSTTPLNPTISQPKFNDQDVVTLGESDRAAHSIKKNFIGWFGEGSAEVVAIHRKNWRSLHCEGRYHAFKSHFLAVTSKHNGDIDRSSCAEGTGGDVNRDLLKLAWFGGSKSTIDRILAYGFTHEEAFQNNGIFGRGIYLSPDVLPSESVGSAIPDEDGVQHLLLCRVLVGKPEVISPGSSQCFPSSFEFDSGVVRGDNALAPKKYVIWTANMNTHILPEYVVSFRTCASSTPPSLPCPIARAGRPAGVIDSGNGSRVPTSPWMSLPVLIRILAKYLPAENVRLISRCHKQFKERKMSRQDLIKRVRQIAGDKLLSNIIKSFRGPAV